MAHLMANLGRLTALALVSGLLAGCNSTQGPRALSFGPVSVPALGGAPNTSSDVLLAELNGGILPADAASTLSRSEKLRALEAEYQALEKTPLGQKVAWSSTTGGASGEVSAGTPYQVGQQNCRQYTHVAVIRGAPVTGRGAACRNADGSWTPLT